MYRLFVILTSILFSLTSSSLFPNHIQKNIYFSDNDPNIMVLGNSNYYEIGFRKTNGSISYISDKTTGQNVSIGSRYECLWGAVFPDGTPDYVGGCSYNKDWDNDFSYNWSATTNTLTFYYTPNPLDSQQVTAQVTVTASEVSWLDMDLRLNNEWGHRLDYVLFPSDLVFVEANIEEALLPILPGIILEPAFFQQDRTYIANYPGYPGVFADYVSIKNSTGHVSIYSLYRQDSIKPVVIGFIHDDEYVDDSTYYYHTFGAGVSDGGAWDSPIVRFRISEAHPDTISVFRTDNGLDLTRSLLEKLGTKYVQLAQSPLYKVGVEQVGLSFSNYFSFLEQVPRPGILHFVGYQPGGHDENYPDFLPPDTRWGTTAEFATMVEQAQDLGLLVMPYTNPTWWDDESPTLENLPTPLTISDVAVLDKDTQPVYEYYGTRGGYVISPYADFVEQRLDQLVDELTIDVPSNLLFEDQVGARPWLFDYNINSPLPTSYIQGWLDHTNNYSDVLLMTELGFDRLIDSEVGFHGSVLLPETLDYTADWWGDNTWHIYPFAPLLARDMVFFYQHDLAPETFAHNKAIFSWDLALGYMLSYDLNPSEWGGGLDNEWIDVVATFQKHVISQYADEKMVDYFNLSEDVTQTNFEDFHVIKNWSENNGFSIDGYVLPQQGVIIQKNNGNLTAGIFSTYNNQPLNSGDHYLIEERLGNIIVLRQPMGADTYLTIDKLINWNDSGNVIAWAYSDQGQVIGQVNVVNHVDDVQFTYQKELKNIEVAYYVLLIPENVYLPLIHK